MMRAGSLISRFLPACLAVALIVAPQPAAALSLEDEEELGREFVTDVKKAFPLVEDEFATDYLNRLGDYLAGAVETKPFPFSFYMIPKNDLNAFAGPGGHIFFFTGLIESMDTVDELAAVASHEMAHITARHLSRRIEQAKKISMATLAGVLIGALVGGDASQAIMIGSAAAGAQAQLAFSRTDERQADQLGFRYMRSSGFDPAAMIEVLENMQSAQVYGTDKIPAYLRTHPTGPERMANMDSLLASGSPDAGTETEARLRSEFPVFRTLLSAQYGDPEASRRRFESELEENPDSPLAHFGLGLLDKEASEYDAAVTHLERSLKLGPDLLPIGSHLAEAYQFTGRYKDAIPVLEAVLDGDPDNRKALFLLATSYQNLDAYARAARIYERLLTMERVREDVSYNLGLCYGRMDRLPLAHYHFGMFFKKTGKPAKARFHFDKAEELGRHDMELVYKIRKAREDLP